jgi:hypothetical protein
MAGKPDSQKMAEDSIMEYIEIKNGVVVGHYSAKAMPEDETRDLKEVENFTAMVGTPVTQIAGDGRLFSKQEIIDKTILSPGENQTITFTGVGYEVKSDYREKSYWKKETGEKVIFKLGDEPDDTMTDVVRDDLQAEWTGTAWEVPDGVLAGRARAKRDFLLAETDYVMLPDYPASNKSEFEVYRQTLRDVTVQSGFPKTINWPLCPAVVS